MEALRKASDELELRVEERTREMEKANEELQGEGTKRNCIFDDRQQIRGLRIKEAQRLGAGQYVKKPYTFPNSISSLDTQINLAYSKEYQRTLRIPINICTTCHRQHEHMRY